MLSNQDSIPRHQFAAEVKDLPSVFQSSRDVGATATGVNRPLFARIEVATTGPSHPTLFRVAKRLSTELPDPVRAATTKHQRGLRVFRNWDSSPAYRFVEARKQSRRPKQSTRT